MRSRGYYKNQTRFDRRLGTKPCDGRSVTDDPQLILDVFENKRKLDDSFRQWRLEDGVNWILGFQAYVDDKNGTLKPQFKDSYIFKRGEIILVDFFGHFGAELTYEHPAIILADTYDGIIIAPISSSCYNDGVATHVSLRNNVQDLGGMKNNCGIKLEQSRFISKRRVLMKFNRVTNTVKLNEIDEVLMQTLTPYSYKLMTTHQAQLLTTITAKEVELEAKDEEIAKLNRKIQLLEQQLRDDQQEETAS
ncbi:type II toxin-antitoxin system PemK/MazF family toxin [Mesobacillus zeae]|uniref:type II toxin-antitoxin system PemK/MazF family toxin n=1 Tax=Mesobacillus zeae TaxID=1917180 RepID=UPI0030099F80